jgi:MoxR-like ATPase
MIFPNFNPRSTIDVTNGGLALTLDQGSVAERCFVWIDGNYAKRGGMAYTCDNSTVRYCALGRQGKHPYASDGRITQNINRTSTLQHNIALDSIIIIGTSDAQGKDGKSVSAALFNQHYFEHTLGWDFDTVWQWNSTLNRPQLQSVGVGATVKPVAASQANTDDLLTQQIRTNIWL